MFRGWIASGMLIGLLLLSACRAEGTFTPTPAPTRVLPTATPTRVLPTPSPTPVIYVVRPGDTLSAIAARFGVSTDDLARANAIQDPNVIKVGQRLVIPGPTPPPTPTVPPTATPTPNLPPQLEIVDVLGRGAPNAEVVIIANRGRGVSLAGWSLRDTHDNVFIFPTLYLAPGAEVRVHTGHGENSPLHLYWNRDLPVWGESGDVAILADERGVIYASKPLD